MRGKSIKKMDNRGSAMITAIIAGVVMSCFCLSLILITYTLYAQTSKRTTMIQCQNLAGDIADELKLELEDENSQLYADLKTMSGPDGKWAAIGAGNSERPLEALTYELKKQTSEDDDLATYETKIVFSYEDGGHVDDSDSDESIDVYDDKGTDNKGSDPEREQWDEMAKNTAEAGSKMVIIEVTVGRGGSEFTLTRKMGVTF